MVAFDTREYLSEDEARQEGVVPLVGVDEAGRGPLAGPVFVSACILPPSFPFCELKDSKVLSEKERERLFLLITTFPDVEYTIESASEKVIDRINILRATLQTMRKAVFRLKTKPKLVLVDGNILPSLPFPAQAIVKGDTFCPSISAASILAKVSRDSFVRRYDDKWPLWRFSEHKGYGTKYHVSMIQKYGILPVHRKSFEPIKSLVSKDKELF